MVYCTVSIKVQYNLLITLQGTLRRNYLGLGMEGGKILPAEKQTKGKKGNADRDETLPVALHHTSHGFNRCRHLLRWEGGLRRHEKCGERS